MQMIPDPDVVRIRESYQTKRECDRIRILESGFGNFYANPRFASDPYRTVRISSSGSDWAIFSCVCKGTRHLDHPWGTGNAMPVAGLMPSRSGRLPNPLAYHVTIHVYHYHLAVSSPESSQPGRSSISARLGGLGGHLRMVTRCRG